MFFFCVFFKLTPLHWNRLDWKYTVDSWRFERVPAAPWRSHIVQYGFTSNTSEPNTAVRYSSLLHSSRTHFNVFRWYDEYRLLFRCFVFVSVFFFFLKCVCEAIAAFKRTKSNTWRRIKAKMFRHWTCSLFSSSFLLSFVVLVDISEVEKKKKNLTNNKNEMKKNSVNKYGRLYHANSQIMFHLCVLHFQ